MYKEWWSAASFIRSSEWNSASRLALVAELAQCVKLLAQAAMELPSWKVCQM